MKKLQNVLLLLGFVMSCLQVQAQFVVQGTVTDDTGEALIGASILEKGTTNGTVTDVYGMFSLSMIDSLGVLVINYTGFGSKEVKLDGKKSQLTLQLREGVALSEVVVTGLGIKRAKKALGYAVNGNSKRKRARGKFKQQNPHPNFNTEDYDIINENRFYKVTKEPQSTFSIDVDAASYSNMRRFLYNKQMPPKDAVRIEEMINYFNYDYPAPMKEHPFEVVTEIAECPWEAKHRRLHIGLQGKKISTDNLPPSNLVFLIDVSGSMQSPNKLPLLKSSFELLVEQMRPQDRVAIVVYAGSAGLVLPSTSGKDKAKILEAIQQLEAGGSTAGGAGIKLAYKTALKNFQKGGNNRVILATDGDFNVGASSDAEMVRLIEEKRESGVFLTVLGFGMGNYKDNKMQKLANKGNGNHAYIDGLAEAKKVLVSEFGGTMFTIAKDVKIQIEFNPAEVAGYRLIGYENRLLEHEDFEDDTKDAGELGAGHTVTALYEIIPAGTKSKYIKSKSKLKYQEQVATKQSAKSGEFASIALRYKKPNGTKSRLIEKAVFDTNLSFDNSSANFRFSAAVAAFGMLLRDSEYKGNTSYTYVLELATAAKGKDEQGYRKDFIKLIKDAQAIANKESLGKR